MAILGILVKESKPDMYLKCFEHLANYRLIVHKSNDSIHLIAFQRITNELIYGFARWLISFTFRREFAIFLPGIFKRVVCFLILPYKPDIIYFSLADFRQDYLDLLLKFRLYFGHLGQVAVCK